MNAHTVQIVLSRAEYRPDWDSICFLDSSIWYGLECAKWRHVLRYEEASLQQAAAHLNDSELALWLKKILVVYDVDYLCRIGRIATVTKLNPDLGIFKACCKYNLLGLAKWLLPQCSLSKAELIHYDHLGIALRKSSLDILKWLAVEFELIRPDIPEHSLSMCNLETIQWIVETFELEYKDLNIFKFFEWAVCSGDVETLNWITNRFIITYDKLPIIIRWAFRAAAKRGCLPVLKWLKGRFPISRSDAIKCPVYNAISNKHIHVLKWLILEYQISWEDLEKRAIKKPEAHGFETINTWMLDNINYF